MGGAHLRPGTDSSIGTRSLRARGAASSCPLAPGAAAPLVPGPERAAALGRLCQGTRSLRSPQRKVPDFCRISPFSFVSGAAEETSLHAGLALLAPCRHQAFLLREASLWSHSFLPAWRWGASWPLHARVNPAPSPPPCTGRESRKAPANEAGLNKEHRGCTRSLIREAPWQTEAGGREAAAAGLRGEGGPADPPGLEDAGCGLITLVQVSVSLCAAPACPQLQDSWLHYPWHHEMGCRWGAACPLALEPLEPISPQVPSGGQGDGFPFLALGFRLLGGWGLWPRYASAGLLPGCAVPRAGGQSRGLCR